MKFSVAISLALAPLALAKSIHNVHPAKRERDSNSLNANSNKHGQKVGASEALLAQSGLILGSLSQVIIIWVNGGNNAATTTVNQVSTVTQTVTAGATQAVTTTAAQTATGTAAAALTTHTVNVGGAKGLVFEPDTIQAAVGDMVVFTFLSQNHTATQSSFDVPCKALAGGMDSGFQANPNNTVNPPPQVAMQVMVDTPLWFYCRQKGHCGKGMTFSINPTAEKSQAQFQQLAIAQNGTGAGGAITGNATTTAGTQLLTSTSAATAVASSAAAGSLTATLGGSVAATTAGTAALASGTGVVSGSGTLNADGSCACAVICAAGSFPAVQAQGIGAFGGMAGALPSTALAVVA